MVSSYAIGTELATLFCVVCWFILTYKNFKNHLIPFGIGSMLTVGAYAVAFIQYYIIFFRDKTIQTDLAMNLLFVRMLLHCSTALVFIYCYKSMPSLRFRR